jgi:hypothetical protein
MRISRLFKRLRQRSSQAFRKRQSSSAFRTCRNADNSVLTVEGTTSKGTGSISCEVEFCIFYRLSLRTLRTKDVYIYIYIIIQGSLKLISSDRIHHMSCIFSVRCFNVDCLVQNYAREATQLRLHIHFSCRRFLLNCERFCT